MRARSMLLGSAAMAGLFAPPALAADLQSAPAYKAAPAPAPVFSWTGLYVGAYVGGTWGRSDVTTNVDCSVPPLAGTTPLLCNPGVGAGQVAAVNAAGTGAINSSGITGGVQAGYNLQVNNIVYGVEADFGAFSLRGSRTGAGILPVGVTGPAFTTGSSVQTDWLFTLRGRIGWATPTWLFYVTGGLGVTELKVGGVFAAPAAFGATESVSITNDKLGFAVGAGAEWALSRNWSVKAEYLFLGFGKVTASGFASTIVPGFAYSQAISTTADLSAHVARVGINYRF